MHGHKGANGLLIEAVVAKMGALPHTRYLVHAFLRCLRTRKRNETVTYVRASLQCVAVPDATRSSFPHQGNPPHPKSPRNANPSASQSHCISMLLVTDSVARVDAAPAGL